MSNDTTPGRVTGIGGIFFKVADPAASLAWYQQHLGIQPGEGFPGSIFRWRTEETQAEASTIWSLFASDTSYFGPPGGAQHMVNYRVDDLDALLAKLEAAGVTILPQREDSAEMGRFAWVVDPNGHRIELWQPPEGM